MDMAHDRSDDELEVLEGDEGQPEVGRHRDVGREMLETAIGELRRASPVTVAPTATVARAAELMRKKKVGAVLVKKGRELVGIFTERDLVVRAMATRNWASAPVKKFMTLGPETLKLADPVAYALNKMSVGRFRHVPLLDGGGALVGIISIRDIVDFIIELCPEEILNLPSQPDLAIAHSPDGG
jgi:CBS domain-containing protein